MPKAPKPSTATRRKSETTRARLIAAAQVVFGRDHFQNARIADICNEAGNAIGIFYRYFSDKQDIFAACVDEFFDEIVSTSPGSKDFDRNSVESIRYSTTLYIDKYQKYHGIVASLFEIGIVSPDIAKIWREVRSNGIRRFSYAIKVQQTAGKCVNLDPELSASALMSMLEFSCYNWTSRRLDFPDRHIPPEMASDNLFNIIRSALEI